MSFLLLLIHTWKLILMPPSSSNSRTAKQKLLQNEQDRESQDVLICSFHSMCMTPIPRRQMDLESSIRGFTSSGMLLKQHGVLVPLTGGGFHTFSEARCLNPRQTPVPATHSCWGEPSLLSTWIGCGFVLWLCMCWFPFLVAVCTLHFTDPPSEVKCKII